MLSTLANNIFLHQMSCQSLSVTQEVEPARSGTEPGASRRSALVLGTSDANAGRLFLGGDAGAELRRETRHSDKSPSRIQLGGSDPRSGQKKHLLNCKIYKIYKIVVKSRVGLGF